MKKVSAIFIVIFMFMVGMMFTSSLNVYATAEVSLVCPETIKTNTEFNCSLIISENTKLYAISGEIEKTQNLKISSIEFEDKYKEYSYINEQSFVVGNKNLINSNIIKISLKSTIESDKEMIVIKNIKISDEKDEIYELDNIEKNIIITDKLVSSDKENTNENVEVPQEETIENPKTGYHLNIIFIIVLLSLGILVLKKLKIKKNAHLVIVFFVLFMCYSPVYAVTKIDNFILVDTGTTNWEITNKLNINSFSSDNKNKYYVVKTNDKAENYTIIVVGDLNKNGYIQKDDIDIMGNYYLNNENEIDSIQEKALDMNKNGKYELNDFAIAIRKTNINIDSTLTKTEDISSIYMTNLEKQTKPTNLLVLIFNYDNGAYEVSDKEIEKAWSDYIFGTGTLQKNTASINDYFKEISNGKFYFNPVLLGNNKTGVYSFHLDKDYSNNQGLHPEYAFFEFNYDLANSMDKLIAQGLNIAPYTANKINNTNYQSVLFDYFDSPQKNRLPQWYTTYKILAIYPPYNQEKVDFTPISSDYNNFSLYAHVNFNSSFGTVAHELVHTLGAVDTYNFGSFGSDLMSDQYLKIVGDYNTMHINPYYKILYGWVTPTIAEGDGTLTLYPQNSDKYNPTIIKTDDDNQYYIVENRINNNFDKVGETNSEGINIWRIDKLGLEAIYENRKGIDLSAVLDSEDSYVDLEYYKDKKNISNTKLVSSKIKITNLYKNNDNSVVIGIENN